MIVRSILIVIALLLFNNLHSQDSGNTVSVNIIPAFTYYWITNEAAPIHYTVYDSVISRSGDIGFSVRFDYSRRMNSKLNAVIGLGYSKNSYRETAALQYFMGGPGSPLSIRSINYDINSLLLDLGISVQTLKISNNYLVLDSKVMVNFSPFDERFRPMLSIKFNLKYEKELSSRIWLLYGVEISQAVYINAEIHRFFYPYNIGINIGMSYKL